MRAALMVVAAVFAWRFAGWAVSRRRMYDELQHILGRQ